LRVIVRAARATLTISSAWLATKADKTTITRLVRIDWQTIGRIIARVGAEHLDRADRLAVLFEVSIDEVAWRKGHRYLTLVGDHRQGCVVWGGEGKGQAAADAFFEELDPPPQAPAHGQATQPLPPEPPGPAIMVPSVPARRSPSARASRQRGCPSASRSSRRSSRAPPGWSPCRWT
jgi:hypothetical protein